jgi:hypothetical protein
MVVLSSGESHLFAANVSPQEQLRGVKKVELSPVNTVEPERKDLSYTARDPHIQHNEHLRNIRPHLSRNEHLRNLEFASRAE